MPITAQRLTNRVITQPPPVRGLNTLDAFAMMPATDAVEMDNFVSNEQGVQLREGWREYATNLLNPVRSIMAYNGSPLSAMVSPVSQSQLFAATDVAIYDIEGGGAMVPADKMLTLSGNLNAGRFTTVQFTTDAGQYLIACSETDGGFLFDGVRWIKMVGTGTAGPGVITGVDPATFVHVCAYKRRLMFVQRNSTVAWILPVGVVGGAAVRFNFGPLLRFGGMLLALINWTGDAGDGIDDRLVVLGSSGDLVIYEGIDPTDATQFQNVGTWFIGEPPIGRRCFTTAGGNILILTVFGIIPVAQVITGGLDVLALSDTEYTKQLRKIQGALNTDFSTLAHTLGWEIGYLPSKAMLIVARPSDVSNEFIQYAFQEHSLAWTRMLDVPAVVFGRRLDEFYGGTDDGRVLRVFDGHADGAAMDGSGSHEIRGRITPAFSYFGDPALVKQSLMARVNFLGNVAPSYVISMNTDFAVQRVGIAPAPTQFIGALWNQAFWDSDFWIGSQGAFGEWRSVEGMGYSLAPTIFVAGEQPVTIASIEYMTKSGGPL